jgi:hypothetical protein
MEEDADQIVQLQSLTNTLYAVIARLRHEIVVWRERDRMARISLGLLNRILVELDRSLYATRVAYNNLHTAHENLLNLYNRRNNI